MLNLLQRYISTILLSRGCGVFGALGHGPNDLYDYDRFKEVEHFIQESKDIKQISAGWGHSAVVTKNGKLFIFGRPFDFSSLMKIEQVYKFSKYAARYVSSSSSSFIFGAKGTPNLGFYPLPTYIEIPQQLVRYVSCSAGLTVVLTDKGDVYCFGLNRWNQCGLEVIEDIHVFEPYKIPKLPPCQSIDTGLQHCIALTNDGKVYIWGKASKGQLGIFPVKDDIPPSSLPTELPFPLKALKVSAGFAHSAVLLSDGSVYVWGRSMSDSCKDKNFIAGTIRTCEDQLIPRRLFIPDNRVAVDICSSNFNLVILCNDGSIWAIGMGEHDRNANPIPLQVQKEEVVNTDQASSSTTTTVSDNKAIGNSSSNSIYINKEVDKLYAIASPQHSLMRKGQQRVSIFIPGTTSDGIDFNSYEVVVHNGEAYLIYLDLNISSSNHLEKMKVVDYSSGWRHSLVLFEEKT